jgi:hypothetical protein
MVFVYLSGIVYSNSNEWDGRGEEEKQRQRFCLPVMPEAKLLAL